MTKYKEKPLQLFFWLLIASLIFACSDTRPFIRTDDWLQPGSVGQRPDSGAVLTFFALGDWGTGDENQQRVASALDSALKHVRDNRDAAPFVFELGDNVYPQGLLRDSTRAEQQLHETFGDIYRMTYRGKPLDFHVIPGNHDHAGMTGGNDFDGDIIHQETTAEALYPNWYYYPIDPAKNTDTNDYENYRALANEDMFQLALPELIPIAGNRDAAFVALDTQVLLDLYARGDSTLLARHWARVDSFFSGTSGWKFLLGHHPVRTHGWHGGYRSAFWWFPPIIFFTIVDKLWLTRLQDLDHEANQAFQRDLIRRMAENQVTFYLSGHEHNLQLLKIGSKMLQLVSGSAGKLSRVTHENDTYFSHSARGFVRFDITKDQIWLEFIRATDDGDFQSSALFKILR